MYGKAVTGGGDESIAGTEAIVASLLGALTNQSITIGESAGTISDGLAEGLGLLGAGGSSNSEATGYLNYLLFDKSFNLVTGGFTPVTASSYEGKSIHNIAIDQPGYLITYLSYESSAPDQVFFDDFSVTLETSMVIQQEDYSPFGLSFASYTAGDENIYKYNGVEQDASTGNYEMLFRGYDPSLGRFMQEDPLTHIISGVSSYHFGFNNPVKYSDALGLMGNNEVYNKTPEDQFGRKKYDTWGNYIPPQDREGGATCGGCNSPDETDNLVMVDEEGHAVFESDLQPTSTREYGTKTYKDGELIAKNVEGFYLVAQSGGSPSEADLILAGIGTFGYVGEKFSQNILNSRSGYTSGKMFPGSASNYSKATAKNVKTGFKIGGWALAAYGVYSTETQFQNGQIGLGRRQLNHLNNGTGVLFPVVAIPIAAGDYLGQTYSDEIYNTTAQPGGFVYEATKLMLESLGIPTEPK